MIPTVRRDGQISGSGCKLSTFFLLLCLLLPAWRLHPQPLKPLVAVQVQRATSKAPCYHISLELLSRPIVSWRVGRCTLHRVKVE